MTLSEDLRWRGLIKDTTFADPTWLDTPRTFYLGVDCSADSLTIGNLAVMLLAKRFIKAGWKAVLLVGGATSLIGDPGGKTEERDLKTRQEIERNVAAIKAQVSRLFEGADFTLVDNYEWFKDVNFLEFLRDVGKHYSMTELVQRDFIASRMGEGGSGISYAEFSYSLIQGYDFWHLYKTHDVVLQLGASDQWGNMLSGAPLIRKKEGVEVHAMSMPLVINKKTGRKFGKSEVGAIWLDAGRSTPTQMYQFWMNCDDEGTEDYLRIYTDLDSHAIGELIRRHKQDPKARLAQATLAEAVTTLVHGADLAAQAARVTGYLTGKADIVGRDIPPADVQALQQELKAATLLEPMSHAQVLVATGLSDSLTEARRLVKEGAMFINHVRVDADRADVNFGPEVLAGTPGNRWCLVRKGSKFSNTAFVAFKEFEERSA